MKYYVYIIYSATEDACEKRSITTTREHPFCKPTVIWTGGKQNPIKNSVQKVVQSSSKDENQRKLKAKELFSV